MTRFGEITGGEPIPQEQYAECDQPGCIYEGTIGMTLVEVDGKLYCDQHEPGHTPEIR